MKQRAAGIYIRKSNEPGESNHSLEVQAQTCMEIVEREGYSYFDKYQQIVSGWDTSADRKEMRRLIGDIEAGHVTVVVVVREDRLGRRLSETAKLLDVCRAHGCQIHTSTNLIDPADPGQALLYNIVSAIAENESASISARVRATLDRLRGVSLTHGTAPFGMQKSERDENKHLRLIPSPTEAPTVVRMAELVLRDRMAIGEVAAVLNKEGHRTRTGRYWTYKAVQATLLNPSLAGYATELTPGASSRSPRNLRAVMLDGRPARIHEQVLPVDDWERIKRYIQPRSNRKRRSARSPLLAGLVHCGVCGAVMHAGYSQGNGRVYRRFVCPGYAYPEAQRCRNSISQLPLEEYIDTFVQVTLKDDGFRKALTQARRRIENPRKLEKLYEQLDQARERVDALDKTMQEMVDFDSIQRVGRQLDEAGQEVTRLRSAIQQQFERADSSVTFEEVYQYYQSLEPSRRRFAIDKVIEEIRIEPEKRGARVALPGVKGGSTVDLGRVHIRRRGSRKWHSQPRETLAPLPRVVECYGCLEYIMRERFAEHRKWCQSSSSGESASSANTESTSAEASS